VTGHVRPEGLGGVCAIARNVLATATEAVSNPAAGYFTWIFLVRALSDFFISI